MLRPRHVVICGLALILGFSQLAYAQESSSERSGGVASLDPARPITVPERSESGDAYRSANRWNRHSQIRYFDPEAAAPGEVVLPESRPENTSTSVPSNQSGEFFDPRTVAAIFAILLLGALIYILVQNGRISLSFAQDPEDVQGAERAVMQGGDFEETLPPKLSEILQNPDRKSALIALANAMLAHAIEANDMLIQRSWTAREALRRLPDHFPHQDALRRLVFTSEHVHFGDRPVSEEEFQEHFQNIRPLLEGRPG